jgi:hypothetical protein
VSYCELLVAKADGQLVGAEEFRNAHGWGAFIWTALATKYGSFLEGVTLNPGESHGAHFDGWTKLWRWVENGAIPPFSGEKEPVLAHLDRGN